MKANKQRGDIEIVLGGIFIVGIILVLVGSIFLAFYKDAATHRNETFTVQKSERIADGRSGRYLLFTDKGVYEDTDSLYNGKFNSSDVYAQLIAGKAYTCDVVGWRNGFFSWYPNVIKCDEAHK